MRLTAEQYAAVRAKQAGADKPAGLAACAKVARLFGSEADILKAVLATLELHPKVGWAARANSGLFEVQGRYVRAGWKGCSDVVGQLKDGRWLACETKSATGRLTADQQLFLDTVNQHGGLAFVARSVDDVMRALDAFGSAA